MNCCGNKRKAFLERNKSSVESNITTVGVSSAVMDRQQDREFEYIGNYSLTLSGVATGKPYIFKFKGDKIKVDHSDSHAMMAEVQLRVLPLKLK